MIGTGIGSSSVGPRRLLRSLGDRQEERIKAGVILRLLHFAAPYRRLLLAAFLFMLVATAGALTLPYLTSVIIDVNIAGMDPRGLWRNALLFALAVVLTHAAVGLQTFLLARVGQQILFHLRKHLFEHLQRLSVAYHDTNLVGVTVSRVINDVSVINNLLSEGLITLIGDAIIIAGTVTVMLAMHARLALLTLSILPLMILATFIFSRKARVAFRTTRESIAGLVGSLAENIGGIKVIQSYAQEARSHEQFEEHNRRNRAAHVRAMSLSYVFLPTVDVLGIAASAIVLLAGGYMIVQGHTSIGVVVAFLSYVSRFFAPIRELSQLFATLQSASAAGERVLQLLDTEPVVQDSDEAETVDTIDGKVELRNLSFAYADTLILKNINMQIEPGQTVAIVGPTGAGKTTIINLICRFYDTDRDAIFLDDRELHTICCNSLHRHMAYVPQEPFLFSATIAENIAFGRREASRSEIIEAARNAEAHAFISNLPAGYDSRVFEGAANLSTGQQQLINIARAMLADPRILIMDEATSSVDTLTEAVIQRALKRLLIGRTAIIIAHRLTTVHDADQIFLLNQGRVVAHGKHEQLMDSAPMYRSLYEQQFIEAATVDPGLFSC